jgi:two-component system NtrC family sensor kinase
MGDAPVVLCVDDESSILSALRRVFLEESWELLFADGGEEGLAVVRERPVDLILSDFRMPGMDGVAFLKEAKVVQPDCVRIVLSGYADINLIVTALNEGEIYRFVPKPWNDDELLDNIRKALEHHRLEHENRRLTGELRDLNAGLERKVAERTAELKEKNRALGFAQVILDVLPMPVLGVSGEGVVLFANAKARDLLAEPGRPLVGDRAPAVFEPELTGALLRARASEDRAHHVMPMILDGEPVGTIILSAGNEPFDLEPQDRQQALSWSVPPV